LSIPRTPTSRWRRQRQLERQAGLQDAISLVRIEEAIKKEETWLTRRKKTLEERIKDEEVKLTNAIRSLRIRWGTDPDNFRHWLILMKNPAAVEELKMVKANLGDKASQLKAQLAEETKAETLKELQG
jgi:predicted metal-dependent hydrolase